VSEKDEVIVAYKGFDKNFQCRGYQFEVGKTYHHDGDVEVCASGFHSCENPLDVWNYYDPSDGNKFAVVKAYGALSRHAGDSKIASASITIEAELKLPEFVAAAISWVKKACEFTGKEINAGHYSQLAASGHSSKLAASGDSSQLAASGDYSQLAASGDSSKLAASGHSSQLAASGHSSKLAASGDSSKLAASGDYSQLAASGDYSQLAASGHSSQLAASGDSSQLAASGHSSKLAASGDSSKLAASGESSIAISAGLESTACAGELGTIVLTRWVEKEKRYRVSVAYVGENGIKPDTAYRLNESGEFEEA